MGFESGPSSPPQSPPSLPPTGWYLGEVGDHCDTTCATHGLLCDEMSLYNHNGDVDTDEELLAIVSTLYTGSMNSYCGYSYGYYANVPLISQQGWCLGTASDRALSTFNLSLIHI